MIKRTTCLTIALILLAGAATMGTVLADAVDQSNILLVYFSRHGSSYGSDDTDAVSSASLTVGDTIVIADVIESLITADRFQIVTVDPYPKDYRETTDVAMDEQTADARPELAGQVENMDAYDTIILGYPNWWGTIPMPVATFLESYDFAGKTILPYCTHEGSRMGSSESSIAEYAPAANLLSGLAIRDGSVSSAQSDVQAWLEGHGLIE